MRMACRLAGWGVWAVLAGSPVPAPAGETVATVLGQAITRAEVAAAPEEGVTPALQLFERIWRPVSRHYINRNGLIASPAEIGEAVTYHREFDRRDRAQRARKLQELNQRLAADGLEPRSRAWLEEFRAVLIRLERRDAERDLAPQPDVRRHADRVVPWIEMWKLNRSLYERYGGVVALTRFGPDPRAARAALIEDYEREGLVAFEDASLRRRLFEWLGARPSLVIEPAEVDFTPYWKRPIPPSYFPD